METTTTIEQDETTATIFDRAVCLSVALHRLGNRRKVKVAELKPGIEVDADSVNVSKELLECEEYDAIRQADGSIRRYLERRTSGPALFRSGVYMLSYDILTEVDQELQLRLRERENVLVPAFIAKYEDAKGTAKARLGPLYSDADYPPVETVAAAFTASTRIFTIGAAEKLKSIRADIFQREQEKAAAQWTEVLSESRNVLRAEFSDLVTHLTERLEPGTDGKKKRFNASLVENLDEFLRTFNARDIVNDADLKAVVEKARAALAGVTPERIRDSRFTRQAVADAFTQIKETVDGLVETPTRRFDFDE